MDFGYRISRLEETSKNIVDEIISDNGEYKSAAAFTTQFLVECQKSGITKVCIGVRDDSVPASMSYPFSPVGSVFAFQPKTVNKRNHRWPPIWEVVERLNISIGCGNGDQCDADTSKLVDGVYHLKNGKFIRVS